MVNIGNDWDEIFKNEKEFEKDYYLNLRKFLISEYKTKTGKSGPRIGIFSKAGSCIAAFLKKYLQGNRK